MTDETGGTVAAASEAASQPGAPPSLPPVEQGTTAAGRPGGRRFPLRWAVAAVVTGVVVVAAAAAWLLLAQPHAGTASAAWLPSDTVGYAELSADLSTGQRDSVLGLLKRFPGFEDQSHLGDKLDETFQRLLQQVGVDYGAQVKPWLGDNIAVGVRAPSATATTSNQTVTSGPPVVTLVASINDGAAGAFIQTLAQKATQQGASVATETYRGVAVTTVTGLTSPTPPQGTAAAASGPRALAVVDGRLVAGQPDMVRAVIDVRRGGAAPLSDRAAFRDAIGSLPGDRVGALWLDPAGLLASAEQELQSTGPVASMAPLAGLLAFSPDAAILGSLQAQDDGLVAEVHGRGTLAGAALLGPSPGTGGPHASRLAASVPANAVVLVDLHDVGATIRTALQAARQVDPSAGQSLDQLNQALAALGTNVDELSGAVGDAALVATMADQPRVGVLLEVKDQAVATRLLSQFEGLAALGGIARITTTDYQGVAVHHVMPTSGTLPGAVTPAYALAGDLLIVGQDESLVHTVIDAHRGGSSIAGDADYTAVMQRIGPETLGSVFVDLEALFSGAVGQPLSAEQRAFVAPLRAVGAGIRPAGEHEWLGSSRLFVLIR